MSDLNKKRHLFHLVDPSPWPLFGALGAFFVTANAVLFFHEFDSGSLLFYSFLFLTVTAIYWWRDVIREATFQGCHTSVVQKGLRLGMILFIVSEVMFFFSFFWRFLLQVYLLVLK